MNELLQKGNVKPVEKKEFRKEILARRDALSEKDRFEKSAKIAYKVMELEEFQKSNKILLYSSMRSEVDTSRLYHEALRLKKDIYYPRVMGKQMEFFLMDDTTEVEVSAYGISEPIVDERKRFVPAKGDEIFVLMPGVVFDELGNRIGYGGGYYDKYLQWMYQQVAQKHVSKVAAAFDCQLVDVGMIECEPHDIHADYIVTESQLIRVESV